MKNYVGVEIQSFKGATRDISFDIYLKLSEENYAHVFSRHTGLDYKRLSQYVQKGVQTLYIRAEDETAYREFIQRTPDKIFADPNVSQEKKIATLLNMTEQNMVELFSQVSVSDETAAKSQKVINNYVELMASNPKTLAVILKLVAHGEYLYYHSIAVAIFSIFIAKATGLFSQNMLETVGLGGFLHDIGSTQLPKTTVCSPTDLTPEQWKEMRSHPKLGLQMLDGVASIPDEVRHIVYQHHEDVSGRGYPNGLHSAQIYYPAKVVAIADAFSALISKRPFRPAYTAEQAVKILQEENGKFDKELVKIVAQIFLRPQVDKKVA